MQGEERLASILGAINARRAALAKRPPLLVKIAPDLADDALGPIVEACVAQGIAGLIISNTTVARPPLRSRHGGEQGGLSGEPLRDMALQRLRDFRKASGGSIPLIGVGGIASAEDAWARIKAGASLVQLYSALVYEGPGLAHRIAQGLSELVRQEGFCSIAEAVGSA